MCQLDSCFLGKWRASARLGVGWSQLDLSQLQSIFPAISFESSFKFTVNFGEKPFRHAAPEGFRSVRHWVRRRIESLVALKAGADYGKLKATTGGALITITDDHEVTVASGFPSALLQGCILMSGKWYYEFTILKKGVAQVGWADLDFVGSTKDGVGVGDDKHSWGVDLERKLLWFNGKKDYGKAWKNKSVIGCAVDVDNRSISFSLDGDWKYPMGVAAENMDFVAGLIPGVTLNPSSIQVNFGKTKFRYEPPAGHESVHAWLVRNDPHKDVRRATSIPFPLPLLSRTVSLETLAPERATEIAMQAISGYAVARFQRGGKPNVFGAASNYPSFIAQGVAVTEGKWCYQVALIKDLTAVDLKEGDRNRASFGWATQQFFGQYELGTGVGDDLHSWGLVCKGKKSAPVINGKSGRSVLLAERKFLEWKGKEIITLCLDLSPDHQEMSFWVNNELVATTHLSDSKSEVKPPYVPALSISANYEVEVNFGGPTSPLTYVPPGFEPIHKWFVAENEKAQESMEVKSPTETNLGATTTTASPLVPAKSRSPSSSESPVASMTKNELKQEEKAKAAKRVLVIHADAGVQHEIKRLVDDGYAIDVIQIEQSPAACEIVSAKLQQYSFDLVVLPAPNGLEYFEFLINVVHSGAPKSKLSFNNGSLKDCFVRNL